MFAIFVPKYTKDIAGGKIHMYVTWTTAWMSERERPVVSTLTVHVFMVLRASFTQSLKGGMFGIVLSERDIAVF